MRTKPLWCALWRDAFTETRDTAKRWPPLARPAFVVQDFASGEIAPINQSQMICRFRTLPLDRRLRCSCVATAEEVEVNSYPVWVRACADMFGAVSRRPPAQRWKPWTID